MAAVEGGDAGAPFVLEDGPAGRAMGRVVDRIAALPALIARIEAGG